VNATAGNKTSRKKKRCAWSSGTPEYEAYHDTEWGVPVHDESALFECLTLEAAQAGLSWSTILAKREGYRAAFAQFDPPTVAAYGKRDTNRLMKDTGIVRNRLKVESTISNARAILDLWDADETLDEYLWNFVDGKPLQPQLKVESDRPSQTPLSNTLSKELKKRGFRFVGPTVIYAFMQAIGMVNDHSTTCFRHREVKRLG